MLVFHYNFGRDFGVRKGGAILAVGQSSGEQGREEQEMSVITKLEERDGGLRKVVGMVEGWTHRWSSEEWWDLRGELKGSRI